LRYRDGQMKRRVRERELGYGDEGGGGGTPLILLHAFPFDRRSWAAVAAALAPNRRVITVDARGFGESPPAGGFSIAELADDLAGLMDALALPSAALGGLSMGGYVALAFARRYPDRLSKLILADTRAAADSPQARAGRAQAIALVTSHGVDAYLDQSLPRLLAPDAPADTHARARELAERRAESLVAGIEALRDRPDRTDELGAIRVPTLVIAGAQDQVVPCEEMRLMSQAIPNSRFIALPGAGHLSNLEAAAPFAEAMASFLGLLD
jgi:3-oxoadipate enol-lactonase